VPSILPKKRAVATLKSGFSPSFFMQSITPYISFLLKPRPTASYIAASASTFSVS
jgi:hypothetical protein